MHERTVSCSLVGVGDVAKRILLGRKLRSSQLGETLLPKRIALPVFASDALSSVAYAPDEIFIMLSLAGASAYVCSWKIGVAVAVVMTAVIASYRQTVHAYPSGGGDYEVATVNLGANAGVTVGSALLVDYVLTVAVSISSGAQYAAGGDPDPGRARGDPGLAAGAGADGHQPARHPRVRHVLRVPDLRLHVRDPRHVRLSACSAWRSATCPRSRAPASPSRRPPAWGARLPHHARPDVPAGPRVLVRAVRRSPASRRSPTACRRSAGPRAATPPARC